MQRSYILADVFCGGGGTSCGAAKVGLPVRWGVDCAVDAMRTYQLNFKDAVCECSPFKQASIGYQLETGIAILPLHYLRCSLPPPPLGK